MVAIEQYIPLPSKQYHRGFIQNQEAIKLRDDTDQTIIGICNPENQILKERLIRYHRKTESDVRNIQFIKIDRIELQSLLSYTLEQSNNAQQRTDNIYENQNSRSQHSHLNTMDDEAPVINLINNLFLEAVRRKASDIHIESARSGMHVRFRVNGILISERTIPDHLAVAVSVRIKVMANLDIMEKRHPQDGRMSLVNVDGDIDARLSIVPTIEGESISIRLFHFNRVQPQLTELGFRDSVLPILRQCIEQPHGLIIAAGPTGSGKTTSLHALLREIVAQNRKIITIEDPVEYRFPGLQQIQIHQKIGLSYPVLLRRVLRQDPDVIMIGEIRDSETAELAVNAALTGHLVLTSLHTGGISQVKARLVELGVSRSLSKEVISGILSQRLIRRLCPACKKKIALPYQTLKNIQLISHETNFPKWIYTAVGCEECAQTGYAGRTALLELYTGTPGPMQYYMKTSMIESGIYSLYDGITTIQELSRVTGIHL